MSLLLIIIHIIVCIALIMIVLLQTGKGADMGAAFGGGSSQTLFGSTGASTFLTKATTAAAIIFMLTSLALAYISGHKTGDSIMIDTKTPIEQQAEPEKSMPAQEPVQKEEATKTAPASEPEASQPDAPVQAEKSSQS
ncbi:MAG: preprotein translocase subunit SecG [Desulfobacterales bacterium]|jgi:preprotein translocase subunit SecG|nr:preprotein translocase subunit SecG [Desulfobacterales bacterium]MDL1987318.1 preprotein translocase subunit SecG [Deltaproteobacteria bacterium]MDL2121853.1 preprotein translocase subunit SecG [Deltaproteobacteria bacterium]